MSNIELFEEKHPNFEYDNIEVYFSELLKEALHNYSYRWDGSINRYLLEGDSSFNNDWFNANYTIFAPNKTEAIQKIKQKIKDIDECFLNYAHIPLPGHRGFGTSADEYFSRIVARNRLTVLFL